MIAGVAFCPHPPVLVPEVAQGAAAELDDLRDGLPHRDPQRVAAPGRRSRDPRLRRRAPRRTARPPAARLAGFGVALEVPLGSDVTRARRAAAVADDRRLAAARRRRARTAARPAGRSAPGRRPAELDDGRAGRARGDGGRQRPAQHGRAGLPRRPRAEAFDARSPPRSPAVTPTVRARRRRGDDLLAAGGPAWQRGRTRCSAARPGTPTCSTTTRPYGVGYFVAAWTAACLTAGPSSRSSGRPRPASPISPSRWPHASAARSSTPTRCSSTRGMDIGTAKLPPAERGGIAAPPARRLADDQVRRRRRVPGARPRGDRRHPRPRPAAGPGRRVRAVPARRPGPTSTSRGSRPRSAPGRYAELAERGPAGAARRLAERDPAAAAAILPTNGRRIVRALEVIELTGAAVHRPDARLRVGVRHACSSASTATTSTSGSSGGCTA